MYLKQTGTVASTAGMRYGMNPGIKFIIPTCGLQKSDQMSRERGYKIACVDVYLREPVGCCALPFANKRTLSEPVPNSA